MCSTDVEYKKRLRSGSGAKGKGSATSSQLHIPQASIKESALTMSEYNTLHTMLTNLTSSVNAIQNDVTTLKSNKVDLSSLSTTVEEDTTKIKILSAIVIKQDARINRLENTVKQMQKAARKNNLIISGLIESPEAATSTQRIEQVKTFFKDQLCITQDIPIVKAY